MNQAALNFDALPESAREGMARCDAHACVLWKRECDAAIREVALTHEFFTVDDVLAELERNAQHYKTHNLAALGPRMIEVANSLKWMQRTGELKRSLRPEKNGNLHRIWRSTIYVQPN